MTVGMNDQIPKPKSQSNPNGPNPKPMLVRAGGSIGIWDLGFDWDLGLGHWDLLSR
jgi:hypothetical protein